MAASLAAALTSYSAAAVAKRAGAPVDLACIYLAPFVEEASKSLLGTALNAPLVAVHVLFGAYECVYDRLGRSRASPAAALSSVACHAAFGIITAAVARGVDEMLMLRLPEVAGRRLAGFLPPSTIAGNHLRGSGASFMECLDLSRKGGGLRTWPNRLTRACCP